MYINSWKCIYHDKHCIFRMSSWKNLLLLGKSQYKIPDLITLMFTVLCNFKKNLSCLSFNVLLSSYFFLITGVTTFKFNVAYTAATRVLLSPLFISMAYKHQQLCITNLQKMLLQAVVCITCHELHTKICTLPLET